MKKLFMLFALIAVLAYGGWAFAADGDELTTTSFRVNSDGQVVYKALVEVPTTNDTVTAAESGKIFFPNISTGSVKFTLPTAAAGLKYTFTAVNGGRSGALNASGNANIYLDPAITDTFVGCVNSATTSTFAVGDSLYSPGITGDSVTIVADAALYWICTEMTGTWVDGGAL